MSDKTLPQIEKELARFAKSDYKIPVSEVSRMVETIFKSLPIEELIKDQTERLNPKENTTNLSECIEKLDIKQLRDFLIPNIERELAAIVEATGSATTIILSKVEQIEQVITSKELEGSLENKDDLLKDITRLYEACSFQDITGQRINKIVHFLKKLEMIFEGMIGFSGDKISLERYHELQKIQNLRDTKQEELPGPMLNDDIKSQADIDKLFQD